MQFMHMRMFWSNYIVFIHGCRIDSPRIVSRPCVTAAKCGILSLASFSSSWNARDAENWPTAFSPCAGPKYACTRRSTHSSLLGKKFAYDEHHSHVTHAEEGERGMLVSAMAAILRLCANVEVSLISAANVDPYYFSFGIWTHKNGILTCYNDTV